MVGEIRFSEIDKDLKETNIRYISTADIGACPHVIMIARHYRDNGKCYCDDPSHTEMAEWGYTWDEEKRLWV